MNCIRCKSVHTYCLNVRLCDYLSVSTRRISTRAIGHHVCADCGTRWRSETPIEQHNPLIVDQVTP